jgi:two-component system, NtrC family, sensor kinase
VLAAELSLADLLGPLHDAAGEGVGYLVGAGGTVLASTAPVTVAAEEQALVDEGWKASAPLTRVVRRADGEAWLASFAPVGVLGWGVVLAQPTAVAFRAADRVRRQAQLWAVAALLLAAGLGLVLPLALTRPVRVLTAAAGALRDGHYDAPLPPAGADELGTLSGTFAHMAAEVRRRDAEIREWNTELQARVEARTTELRAAEEQIIRSRHLSALGSLSAGVAQGLNDPLTSVVGLVTLARSTAGPETEAGRMLGTALTEARRVTAVVHDLRRLAAPGLAQGARRFGLDRPVEAAVERFEATAAEKHVELAVSAEPSLPPMEGDPEQIESLVARLLENALAVTPSGGRVAVSVSAVEGSALRLVVSDTGPGIPPGVRDRIFDPFFSTSGEPGAGLGLSLVHGIVEAHHGRIQADGEPGQGATFTVHFPAASTRAQEA